MDTDPHRHVVTLAFVGGLVQTLHRAAQQRNAGALLSLTAIVLMAAILGPISGLISLFVGGWFMRFTGRSLGGRATPVQVRAAIAWSLVPIAASMPLSIIQIPLLGRRFLSVETSLFDSHPVLALILLASALLQMVLGIWSFVIFFKCVGEVHGFSAWKAIGSLILALVVIVVPIVPIAFLVLFSV